MEKISINIFTKSQPTNFEFLKTKIIKKTGRQIHDGTENSHGFIIVQKKMPCFVSVACLPKIRAPFIVS